MIAIRRSEERGHFNHGWLETYHTFSFGDYRAPTLPPSALQGRRRGEGFLALRVINEDWVMPGQGFPTHAHRDMEILTYILEGALEHKDSMGNTSVIRAGDVQRMSAGTGVEHSEYNASQTEPVHLLQIWFYPKNKSIVPGYEQKTLNPALALNQLRLIVSPDGEQKSVSIHQDLRGYDCVLNGGKSAVLNLGGGRGAWLQLVSGQISVGQAVLEAGDGAAFEDISEIQVSALQDAFFLMFDLP